MKTIILLLLIGCSLQSAAQAPNQFNYQAVARNTLGQNIPNANIKLRLTILDGGPTGTNVYSETRQTTTNQMGLFTAAIGGPGAASTTGNFATINWSTGKKYIQVEVDPLGGNSFTVLGNTEMLSVPYALYAVNGAPGVPGPASTLSIGTVTTGPTAAATITGASPSQILNLTIPAGSGGKSALIKTSFEPAGTSCSAGGSKIETGQDANGNNILDATEVTGTQYICNSTASGFWSADGLDIYNNNPGKVGIGLNKPLAPLHIKKDQEALRLEGSSPYIGFYNNAGTALKGYIQNVNDSFYLGTPTGNTNGILQFYLNNSPKMTLVPNGNIGIGTSAPADKLTVHTSGYGLTQTDGTATIGTWIGNFAGVTTAKMGTKSNHALNFFTNNGLPQMTLTTSGNLGIGTESPNTKLTVETAANSYGIAHRSTNGGILATYFGGTSAGIGTFTNTNMRIFSGGTSAMFVASGTGNIGIGVDFPANKLQIGSVGSTGFATNDFAIGNGTNAMAIYQTNASTLIGATTDIVLKPRNNGHGRVGINTDNPRASLDVDDNVVIQDGYYAYMNGTGDLDGIQLCKFCDPQISIIASYGIYAAEFDAFSDARIKNITGVSNAAKDLETINALRITDYTMKDKAKYGSKSFKKVIAQEVEKIYPQAVSVHKDFIPNVYQLATQIAKVADGYLLTFSNKHNISVSAKKLKVLLSEKDGMQGYEIISLPSDTEVIVKAGVFKIDKAFVYGEEVDDFRTVDYEGLTTLNISATQELSSMIKKQQAAIELQNQKIAELTEKIKLLLNKQ